MENMMEMAWKALKAQETLSEFQKASYGLAPSNKKFELLLEPWDGIEGWYDRLKRFADERRRLRQEFLAMFPEDGGVFE